MAATQDTVDTTASQPGNKISEKLREALGRLTNQQKIALMVAVAAIAALIMGTILWSRQPDYKVLFSNLSEKDGGTIITALEQLNVPYKFTEGGGAILVPGEKVHEVRLRLASQGLPKGGAVGFELMENQKFGISQFAEQVNFQRALEGELGRTIQSVAAVESARVHLAIPKPSVFVREEQKPTASVMVHLHPGRTLEPAQVAGIVHLVSSSVPQLPMSNVTVIDQNGNLISQLKSKLIEAGLDPTQIKYVQEVEASVIKRIDDILAPVVGPGNARVQVAADIDFSQTEQTAESYRPNTTPPDISIRSQQTSETANVNPPAQGVPGALTNQPPVPATAPITSPPVAGQATAQTGATNGQPPPPGQINAAGVQAPIYSAGQPINTRKDSTINYEVDKTIKYVKQSVGVIKRLSVAVVVNNKKDTTKDGKPTTRPLTEAELKQINDLAREAMGYAKERGDTLSVANAAFTAVEKEDNEPPLWKQLATPEMGKDLLKYLLIGAIVAYILLAVVRPILRTMFPPPSPEVEEEEGEEGEEDVEVDLTAMGGDLILATYEGKMQKAREIAHADPKAVANIIKDWMGVNAG
ncbi:MULTISPECIES: flagellar basal-body MS-ring/collar protein FliF [Azospira]|uniref:Flagellar M-ring protein n=2 Tax=Azospira oryzae TaxID=146939 RepID=G8QG68_AZOOP|nr:flagellar basal-body MS-ring/collar protein FliF [Azospira oryzae]AEV26141.1 flagellar basal-body M-ring protein/flagellar hook-basal body protein FliF [Azospira oryzae PS]MBP7488712.1 flagellar M-ring protein FliF [Azospira sp.]RZT75591.1 flagellar M-ring protein FliF [Azospira oryzae]TLS19561.1 MAG: flagellar basal body M-ring protein FliF [Betaproteobacteria bacterium]